MKILVTTSDSLMGWDILEYVGPILTTQVGGAGFFNESFAAWSDLLGAKSNSYQKVIESLTDTTLKGLKEKAKSLRANCIIGLTVDVNQISGKNMQLFKITAYGTAVIAKQISSNQTLKSGIRLSGASIKYKSNLLYLKDAILKRNLTFSNDQYETIVQSKDPYFADFIIERITRFNAQSHTDEGPAMVELLSHYFLELDNDVASKILYDKLLKNENNSITSILLNIIKVGSFFDFNLLKSFFSNEDITIRKRGLSIVYDTTKNVYSISDVEELKNLLKLIEETFVDVAKFTTKKQTFGGEKEIWICTCGRENAIATKNCDACKKDTKGFLDEDVKLDSVIKRINYRITAIEELASEESN